MAGYYRDGIFDPIWVVTIQTRYRYMQSLRVRMIQSHHTHRHVPYYHCHHQYHHRKWIIHPRCNNIQMGMCVDYIVPDLTIQPFVPWKWTLASMPCHCCWMISGHSTDGCCDLDDDENEFHQSTEHAVIPIASYVSSVHNPFDIPLIQSSSSLLLS